jgi:hypothetical protein
VTSPPTLTRPDATGANNELWIEIYGATGSTQPNVTISYKDQNNNPQTITFPFIYWPNVGEMMPCPLAAGSTGVRSITSVQLSGSTGTAGNWGLTILRRLGEASCVLGGCIQNLDSFALGLPTIDTSACLFALVCPNAAYIGDARGALTIVQG